MATSTNEGKLCTRIDLTILNNSTNSLYFRQDCHHSGRCGLLAIMQLALAQTEAKMQQRLSEDMHVMYP